MLVAPQSPRHKNRVGVPMSSSDDTPFDSFDNLFGHLLDYAQTDEYKREAASQHSKERARRRKYERSASFKQIQSNWKSRHPGAVTAARMRWARKNPEIVANVKRKRRARKRNQPFAYSSKDWQVALRYWDDKCAYCGCRSGLFFFNTLVADHFVPLASDNAPGTTPTNIVPACVSCNSSKSDRNAAEWLVKKFGKRKAEQVIAQIQVYFDWLRSQKSRE